MKLKKYIINRLAINLSYTTYIIWHLFLIAIFYLSGNKLLLILLLQRKLYKLY